MRRHLTYANVVSTLCLFVVLGGTSYAAVKITGKNVKDGSLTGADVRANSINGGDVSGLRAKDFASPLPAGAKGPAGARGPAGAAGATNVVMRRGTSSTTVSNGIVNNAFASCLPGERAVGGGALWDEASTPGMPIVQSNPNTSNGAVDGATPTEWAVSAGNTTGTDKHIRAWVVCASP